MPRYQFLIENLNFKLKHSNPCIFYCVTFYRIGKTRQKLWPNRLNTGATYSIGPSAFLTKKQTKKNKNTVNNSLTFQKVKERNGGGSAFITSDPDPTFQKKSSHQIRDFTSVLTRTPTKDVFLSSPKPDPIRIWIRNQNYNYGSRSILAKSKVSFRIQKTLTSVVLITGVCTVPEEWCEEGGGGPRQVRLPPLWPVLMLSFLYVPLQQTEEGLT